MTQAIDEVPAKFYKYRSMKVGEVEWVERIVLHNEIFCAAASTFNDPFDLRPVFCLDATPQRQRDDYIRLSKKYDSHLTQEQHSAAADDVMMKSLSAENVAHTAALLQLATTEMTTTQVGVFCVSTKCDDILMWSHYADSHKGVCLEFDGMSMLMAEAQKVQYVSNRVPINPYEDNRIAMMERALLTKSEHWAYEAEWRLCRYEEGPGVVEFRPQNLTGIILGALASRETKETIRKWVAQRTSPVKLYRATTSSQKFELLITPTPRV